MGDAHSNVQWLADLGQFNCNAHELIFNSIAELAEQCFVTGGDNVFVHVARALALVPQLRAQSSSGPAGKLMREKVNLSRILEYLSSGQPGGLPISKMFSALVLQFHSAGMTVGIGSDIPWSALLQQLPPGALQAMTHFVTIDVQRQSIMNSLPALTAPDLVRMLDTKPYHSQSFSVGPLFTLWTDGAAFTCHLGI